MTCLVRRVYDGVAADSGSTVMVCLTDFKQLRSFRPLRPRQFLASSSAMVASVESETVVGCRRLQALWPFLCRSYQLAGSATWMDQLIGCSEVGSASWMAWATDPPVSIVSQTSSSSSKGRIDVTIVCLCAGYPVHPSRKPPDSHHRTKYRPIMQSYPKGRRNEREFF